MEENRTLKRRTSLYHERHPVSARNSVQMANASQTQRRWLDNGGFSWGSNRLPRGFPSICFSRSFLSAHTALRSFPVTPYTFKLFLFPSAPTRSLFFFLGFSTKPSSFGEYYSKKKIYFCFIDCAKAFDCVDHKKLENSERDGDTRPPDLPLEKPICRSGSNN